MYERSGPCDIWFGNGGGFEAEQESAFYPGIHERLLIKIYSEQGHLVGAPCRLA